MGEKGGERWEEWKEVGRSRSYGRSGRTEGERGAKDGADSGVEGAGMPSQVSEIIILSRETDPRAHVQCRLGQGG